MADRSALIQQDEMAEVLREWNDEEDEVVEFIHSPSEGTRQRSENGSLYDRQHTPGERKTRERSTLTGKPFYAPYIRCAKTFCLFFSFLGLGISNTLYGPTILDLAYHTSSTLSQMSYVFTARSVGYLVGSITGGYMYDRYNAYLVLGCSALGCTLAMIVFPLVRSVYAMIMIGAAMAIGAGSLDTAGNAILFVLAPRKSQPYMQFLHFTFAAGAFLAPLIAKPFLLPDSVTNPVNKTTISNQTSDFSPDDIPSVTWAYWLGTLPCIMSGIFFLACAFFKALKDEEIRKERQNIPISNNNRCFKGVILCLFFTFFLVYVGLEAVYGAFIFAFAVKSKPYMDKDNASLLTATYWGTFAAARLLAVPLSKYLKPQKMLFIDIIGCLIATVILISQAHDGCDVHSSPKLWSGTVILGISAASIFGAAINWVEFFLDVSGRVASLLLVGACVGEMIIPVAVGNTFQSVGPCTLMYCVFTLSFLCLVNFAAILLFGRHFQSSNTMTGLEFHKKGKTDEELPKPKEQDEDEVLKLLEQNNEIFNGN